MKMLNLSSPFTFTFMLTAFLTAGCTTDVAGTAEEQNEFKELAELESSSSITQELPSSSSIAQSSSSTMASSSSISNQSTPVKPNDTNTLSYYLLQYGITDADFDSNVLASAFTYKEQNSAPPQSSTDPNHDGDTKPGTAAATEFDGFGVHAFVKQNIDALEHLFPDAYEKFTQQIADIKDGNMEEGCGLYMLNTYGSAQFVGHVLADIQTHTVTILDIKADACLTGEYISTIKFLFSYCGEIDKNPEIVHKTIEANIPKDKCPQTDSGNEWLK